MKKILFILLIAVFACNCAAKQRTDNLFHLNIKHFNDTHTSSDEIKKNIIFDGKTITVPIGGYARLISAIERYSTDNDLVIFAGDALQKGSVIFETSGVNFDCKMLQMAKIDVMTVGNHEFDGGIDGFKKLISCMEKGSPSIDILAANLKFEDSEISSKIKPYIIKTVNSRKIGIAGLSVPESSSISSIKGLGFKDSLEISENITKEMKSMGVDIIIFVTHHGFPLDIELAKNITDIDVIIGGHTHTVQGDFSPLQIDSEIKEYPLTIQHANGNKTLIATASSKTQNLGIMDIKFDNNGVVSDVTGNSMLLMAKDGYTHNNNPITKHEHKRLISYINKYPSFLITDNSTAATEEIKNFKKIIDPIWFNIKFSSEIELKTLRDSNEYLKNATIKGHSSLGVHQAQSSLLKARSKGHNIDAVLVNTGSLKRNLPA